MENEKAETEAGYIMREKAEDTERAGDEAEANAMSEDDKRKKL